MALQRRSLLAGLGGAAFLCSGLPNMAEARTVTRTFDIMRGRSRIGSEKLTVTRNGGAVSVAIDVDIKVRILGLPAYSYTLRTRENWEGGRLVSLNSKCNANGKSDFAKARATRSGLKDEGSKSPGTYWAQGILPRPVWINTQTGYPMEIQARKVGIVPFPYGGGTTRAAKYRCTGDIGLLDLFYDANGEWIGNEFEVRGQKVRFVVASKGAALAPLSPVA